MDRQHVYDYDGDMYHFHNDKVDLKVTPNHKLFVSKKEYEYHGHRSLRQTYWGEWKSVEARVADCQLDGLVQQNLPVRSGSDSAALQTVAAATSAIDRCRFEEMI